MKVWVARRLRILHRVIAKMEEPVLRWQHTGTIKDAKTFAEGSSMI